MPPDEYQRQRNMLLEKGAGILRDLDNLPDSADQGQDQAKHTVEPGQPSPSGVEIRSAAGNRRLVATSDPNDELEVLIANRRRSRNEKASGFCPRCGGPLQKSDQFCSKCGFKLPKQVSQSD